MDTVTLVQMTLSTLNTIEVKGQKNLNALLGCMNALETVVQQLTTKNQEAESNG